MWYVWTAIFFHYHRLKFTFNSTTVVRLFINFLYLLVYWTLSLSHHIHRLIVGIIWIRLSINHFFTSLVLNVLSSLWDSVVVNALNLMWIMWYFLNHFYKSFFWVNSLNYNIFLFIVFMLLVLVLGSVWWIFLSLCLLMISVIVLPWTHVFNIDSLRYWSFGFRLILFLPLCSIKFCYFSQLSDLSVNVFLTSYRKILIIFGVIFKNAIAWWCCVFIKLNWSNKICITKI